MKDYCKIRKSDPRAGFSMLELLISMTITLVILTLVFSLLGQSINEKVRYENQAEALANSLQSLTMISREIANAGFALESNGLVAADCSEDKIRIRSNLNALRKETTSNTVSDQDEDIEFFLVTNPDGENAIVRADVGIKESGLIATRIDNNDLDKDGDNDGLTFNYLDKDGNEVAPSEAVRVRIAIQIVLPQIGQPGTPGYKPQVSKLLYSSAVLRNTRLLSY